MDKESCCPVARWRRRKEVRPAEILDAALALFVEKVSVFRKQGRHLQGGDP